MDDESLAKLKAFKLFSTLDAATTALIINKLIQVDIKQGDILFRQGDPSDCMYLLVKGKLSAILTNPAGINKTVGFIEAGETVGESGALTNDPRSATIMAVTSTTLYQLNSNDLLELCHQHPSVMFAIINPVIDRSQKVLQLISAEKTKKHIALIPANPHINVTKWIEKLTDYLTTFPNVILFSDYSTELSELAPNILQDKLHQITKNKKSNQKIIYLLKSPKTALAKLCFKKADMLYLITLANTTPHIDNAILGIIESHQARFKFNPSLILLHSKETLAPHNTAKWLEKANFGLHHHVRVNMNTDMHRLVRFIRDKAVGLVLGGGGTRGWAHLGVIKALKEAKIPIDVIGGTSVGAIIAACYAIHLSYEEAYERFYDIVRQSQHSVSWRSITWPAISIFDAKRFTLSQQNAFGHIRIEDLWIPYFNISCNMTTNAETIHRSGLVWEKVRASSSIPGVIPPMVLDGELHFDGGLLNNLPVDIMRQWIGMKGRIIASELSTNIDDNKKYGFPPILTFKQALLAKLGWGYKNYRIPPFIDTFLKAILVGSLFKSKQNGLSANVLINFNLSEYSMLHADLKQADRLTEKGYQEAMKQLNYHKVEQSDSSNL